jgi:hypothetical protein
MALSQRLFDILARATKTPAIKLVTPQIIVKKTVIRSPKERTPRAEYALSTLKIIFDPNCC